MHPVLSFDVLISLAAYLEVVLSDRSTVEQVETKVARSRPVDLLTDQEYSYVLTDEYELLKERIDDPMLSVTSQKLINGFISFP